MTDGRGPVTNSPPLSLFLPLFAAIPAQGQSGRASEDEDIMVREGEEGARGGWERAQGGRKKEVAEGNLSLEGPASSSVLHPSDHHNEKAERLKAMNKDMFGVRGGGEGSVEQLVSLLTGLQSFFFFFCISAETTQICSVIFPSGWNDDVFWEKAKPTENY